MRHSILAVAVASQIGASQCGDVAKDPGFDVWCGDQLCYWGVEHGSVSNTTTWSDTDRAVELSADTAIAQYITKLDTQPACFEIDVLAYVFGGNVTVNIDVNSDGSVEKSIQIPATDWTLLTYKVAVAGPFSGMKIEVATGDTYAARFARLDVSYSDGCDGIAPLVGGLLPDGAQCDLDGTGNPRGDECVSGTCFLEGTGSPILAFCASCDPSAAVSTCPTGQRCATPDAPHRLAFPPYACEAPGQRPLGAACTADTECTTGLCSGGWCSACDDTHPCAGTEACVASYHSGPQVCDPQVGGNVAGGPCLTHTDCVSDVCVGTPDRRCNGSDAACNVDADCNDGDIVGVCDTLGVLGGVCQ